MGKSQDQICKRYVIGHLAAMLNFKYCWSERRPLFNKWRDNLFDSKLQLENERYFPDPVPPSRYYYYFIFLLQNYLWLHKIEVLELDKITLYCIFRNFIRAIIDRNTTLQIFFYCSCLCKKKLVHSPSNEMISNPLTYLIDDLDSSRLNVYNDMEPWIGDAG